EVVTTSVHGPGGISKKPALHFEQVNEVTWKLTNGEIRNVPTSHGQWAGFRTTKALAWVINVVTNSSAWLAHYRDRDCGHSLLNDAKANALTIVRDGVGDYTITDPIGHLNGLTARVIDDA